MGWRAEVTAKRGSKEKNTQQIKIYGAWFYLSDTERIVPIEQLEEEGEEEEGEEESEEEEGDEEEGDEDSSDDIGTRKRPHPGNLVPDSSDGEGAHLSSPANKQQKS